MTTKPFVFVSYARTDRDQVRRVADELRKLGVETWVDSERLAAGDSWERYNGCIAPRHGSFAFYLAGQHVQQSYRN
jgi:hypothetical protein